jgi:cell division protein YceG involved in septum cleavage
LPPKPILHYFCFKQKTTEMKAILTSLILVLAFSATIFAEGIEKNNNNPGTTAASISIQGVISDKITQEELAGASVSIVGTDIIVKTDLDGNFKIENLKPGNYDLKVSYIAYKEAKVENLKFSKKGDLLQITMESL